VPVIVIVDFNIGDDVVFDNDDICGAIDGL
jgi:hypothetical protein